MNSLALQKFIEGELRPDALVGLHYVVEIKAKPSNRLLIKCNLCKVKGQLTQMQGHLLSVQHIKMYMEKHYKFLFDDILKRNNDAQIRLYAKEIERMEGLSGVHIEYVTEPQFDKEQASWIPPQFEVFGPDDKPQHCPVYRRKLAVLYSRNLKISSREEAAEVLKLTEQLNDRLEMYYLKCKGLENAGSTVEKDFTNTNTLSPVVSENINCENTSTSGLNHEAQKTPQENAEPSTSMYSDNNKTSVPGQFLLEQNTPISKSSSNNSCSNFEAATGSGLPVSSDPKEPMTKTVTDTDKPSSQSSSFHEQSSEMSSSSRHTHGKTSKTLSPDILLLLKGKDARSVTNILKTLAPFYPALQDVNLEMLAQVLVNTGALD